MYKKSHLIVTKMNAGILFTVSHKYLFDNIHQNPYNRLKIRDTFVDIFLDENYFNFRNDNEKIIKKLNDIKLFMLYKMNSRSKLVKSHSI
jgi:hypothetical protein